jgi:hypothetical protein
MISYYDQCWFHVFSSYMASLCIIDLPYNFKTYTFSYNASSSDNKSMQVNVAHVYILMAKVTQIQYV